MNKYYVTFNIYNFENSSNLTIPNFLMTSQQHELNWIFVYCKYLKELSKYSEDTQVVYICSSRLQLTIGLRDSKTQQIVLLTWVVCSRVGSLLCLMNQICICRVPRGLMWGISSCKKNTFWGFFDPESPHQPKKL